MPSKHTVVVSLDAETEAIVKALGGNRSEWIRDAIKWRHGPGADLEVMEALADARKRQLNIVEKHMKNLIWMLEHFEDAANKFAPGTLGAMVDCTDWLELR